jgi:hypothetical protein
MFFRPEEIYAASCVGKVSTPLSKGDIHIAANSIRSFAFNDPIPHHYTYFIAAFEAESLNSYSLTGEEPADR